ncbi:MAG TPA: cytochrome c oxidase accessory protein CcoG, partial [Cyclobacteriaceae bacterium]|nr:cytochrome c oxidase accessory protein CcoG [Cyclobacteriaceae bacterium]
MQKEDLYSYDDQFRDRVSTVDNAGKRLWVYPKKPSGRYHNARVYVSILLVGLLFIGPFIKTDGHPFMLFDIINRRFVIFGTPFWPQDFHIFAIALITFVVFIVLFTVVYGRVWCGWACPQTIFMEMIFRKIEYLIEGDSGKQRKLDQMPWNAGKTIKRAAKHFIFILISILISHILMAYLVGIEKVKMLVSHSPMENLAGFAGIVFFTGFFYLVFAYFREQVCTTICPYGRLQGVFVGKNTIAVMYDWLRGEPRGRLKKDQHEIPAGNGDCVDCKLCIHVCPTGIDIRNGIQLECVNCTACMDACDEVMDKIRRKRGLIRFGSYNSISESKQNLFTPRVIGYSIVLFLLISFLIYFIGDRPPVETTVLRVPGTL